jgi:hypothetical protein
VYQNRPVSFVSPFFTPPGQVVGGTPTVPVGAPSAIEASEITATIKYSILFQNFFGNYQSFIRKLGTFAFDVDK